MSEYKVKKGDYLIKIAREKGVSVKTLVDANPQISNPNLIYPGDSITIPDSQASTTSAQGPDGLFPPPPAGGNNYEDDTFRTMDEMGSPFAELEVGPKDRPEVEENNSVAPEPEPPKRFIKGKHGRSHAEARSTDFFGNVQTPFKDGNDGTNEKTLVEPIPKYFSRPGDGIITATGFQEGSADNNTMIIMGRDRTGLGEIDSADKELRKSDSGFSTHMAAGAIDIVVGRCSPFPLSIEGKSWGPIFNTTKKDSQILGAQFLEGVEDGQPFTTSHPGYAMDASRIYISQMTNIDENFKIEKQLYPGRTIKKNLKKKVPTSGIAIKSDKIRIHARQDVKIVTHGPHEKVNSQGNDITETGGIHLMAGNGMRGFQQPIPKGDNLAEVIDDIADKIDSLAGIVFSFVESQMKFNKTLGSHTHNSPFKGIPTTPSITAGPHSVETVLSQFGRVTTQIIYLKSNLAAFRNRYLEYGSAEYINSEYNTTN